MPAPVDYVAAALAAVEAPAPEAPAAVGPAVSTPAPGSAGAAEEGPTAAEASVPPGGDKKEVSPAEDKKPATRIEKGFEDLARERAAFRAEKAELSDSRALADAAKRGDAMALLAAAKIPWAQAAEQVLSGTSKVPGKPAAPAEPDERDRRIAALEKDIAATKEAAARQNLMGQLKARTKSGDKFPLLAAHEAESEAMSYIERYYNETGELPGSNIDETLEIALEAVEAKYAKEAARWEGVLTKVRPGAVLPVSKSAVPSAVGAVSQQAAKTLTNNVGAGPQSAPAAPKKLVTDEDYRLAAIQALTAQ